MTRPARARALAVLAPSVIVGCGLAAHESDPSSIRADGVSGFGDASPIELCLGTARVVPLAEAGASAAVCIPDGSRGASCSGDAGCSGIEECICGRCVVEVCQGAASCGGGRVCRGRRCTTPCAADVQCAPGERCVSGGCARSCADDSTCHFGEQCGALDGVCSVKLCGGALQCGAGAICEPVVIFGEVREPTVVAAFGERVVFLEIRTPGEFAAGAIFRAHIDAPDRWRTDPRAPALAPPEGAPGFGAPAAIARGPGLELYFVEGEGSRIRRAVSFDRGASFQEDGAWKLEPAEPWEAGYVGSPSVFDHGGASYLLYEGGPRAGIGLARIMEGGAERISAAPVLAPAAVEDPLFWRGVTEVGAPHALVVGEAVRVYFTARGAEGGDALSEGAVLPAARNDSIGLVTTRDLAAFDRYPTGPIFGRVANLRTYLGEREASVELLPSGSAEITFIVSDASGTSRGGPSRAASR